MHIRRHVPAMFPAFSLLLALMAAPRADAASTCGGFIPAPITTPAQLVQAVSQAQSANCPGADVIDLGGNTVTFTIAAFTDGGDNLALPPINTLLSIVNGTITRSSATGFRFLLVQSPGELTLTGLTLSNGGGVGTSDGGAIRVLNARLAVANTTFRNNTAPDYGGGAILAGGISDVTVTDALFQGNTAGAAGGAINLQLFGGSATIDRTRFLGNGSSGTGGAISKDNIAPVTIRDSLFAGNAAVLGSALISQAGSANVTLINVTAVGGDGQAISIEPSITAVAIRNSLVWGNAGGSIGAPASASITYTAANGVAGATINGGYVVEDIFVAPLTNPTAANTGLNYNAALYDWTLRPFSPAIDAAQNTYASTADAGGGPRRVDDTSVADAGNGTAPIVDMGAYERANASCTALTFPHTLGGASNGIRGANLRTAVHCANLNGASPDTIDLAGQTVTFPNVLDNGNALPQITTPVTLANGIIERDSAIGVLNFRLLTNATTGTLALADMTLRNGYLDNAPNQNGAAILNRGVLSIQRSTLSGNTAYDGGALYNALGATATISRSSLRDNVSHNNGGAAFNAGTLALANATITGNTSRGLDAGAVFSDGGSTLTLVNATISGNNAPTAVGISGGLATYGAVTLANSILANNTPHDCQRLAGTLTFSPGASNIIESNAPSGACGTAGSTHLAVDPQLGALTGAPAYLPLGATSPAVNAGDNGSIGGATLDQPGNARIQQGRVDLGSVESPFAPVVTTLQFNAAISSAAEAAGFGNVLRVTTSDGNPTAAASTVIVSATGGSASASDYTLSGTITVPAGTANNALVSIASGITVVNEILVEPNETLALSLTAPTGAVLGAQATTTHTISNDDTATVTIADAAIVEGNAGLSQMPFTVTVDGPVQGGFVLDFATADLLAMTADSDYNATAGTLNFTGNAGETQTLNIAIAGDTRVEPDETFRVAFPAVSSSVAPGALVITDTATGTILNDDAAVLSVGSVAQDEGDTGTAPMLFTVTIDRAVAGGFTVDYATADGTATVADNDYVAASGTLTFVGNAGESQSFGVDIPGDQHFEADETFAVTLAGISAAGIAPGAPASGTIRNDDAAAGVIVAPLVVVTTEGGGSDTFTVILASAPSATVMVDVASSDVAEGTVSPTSHTFTSANWNQPATFTVTGVDDDVADGDAAYTIAIAPIASADPSFNGIDPDDVAATNSDDDSSGIVVTPTAGLVTTEAGGSATFSVALASQPAANVVIGLSSSDTGEGTVAPATLVFDAANWNVAQLVTVTGVDDATVDGAVAYAIVTAAAASTDPTYGGLDADDVAVTNEDDDSATLRIDDVSLAEGDGGTTAFVFTVTLDGAIDGGVTVAYATADDIATAPVDYAATSGSLHFDGNDGETQTITVPVVGDTLVEGEEGFRVVLSAPTPASVTLARADAIGTILDDDAGALLSARKRIVQAGTATLPAIYEIVLSNSGDGDQADDPASDELVDVLPAALALNDATATTGTVTSAGNTVRWNGALAAGATVTLRIEADVVATTAGPISNQAQIAFDSDGDGSNDANGVSDNPSTPGMDATVFVFAGMVEPPSETAPQLVPAADVRTLVLLVLSLGLFGMFGLRRRDV